MFYKQENYIISQLTVTAAETRGHFGHPEETERPPLVAVTIRIMKTKEAEKTSASIVTCEVCTTVRTCSYDL
jgi:hypothetical protein